MNEFIVWDEDNFFGEDNRFYTVEEFIKKSDGTVGFTYNSDGDFLALYQPDDGEYTGYKALKIKTFNYIGKTDDTPEQNKIYADSSIVEFYTSISHSATKLIGFISFNTDEQCSEILVRDDYDGYDRYDFLQYDIYNIKVIGTLQENHELFNAKDSK